MKSLTLASLIILQLLGYYQPHPQFLFGNSSWLTAYSAINLPFFLSLLHSNQNSQEAQIGDPGWVFDESRSDPRFPEMKEWAQAGVLGGIPLRNTLTIKTRLTPGQDLQAAIDQVATNQGGVILLEPGEHRIDKLRQPHDLRGSLEVQPRLALKQRDSGLAEPRELAVIVIEVHLEGGLDRE